MEGASRPNAKTIVGLHLDLKGVMPRPDYVPELFADLASQGINTVLVEYEDTFPFEGIDVAWDRSVCFTSRSLCRFLAAAAENGIEVIPLQQCLGHLEYVFRWKRYRRWALNPAYPGTVDLGKPRARALVREMLRQVIEAHPDSRFVHLGLDEAQLAPTGVDAARVDVLGVFLDYLRELTEFVEGLGKTPVVWSDMLQDHFSTRRIRSFQELKDRVVLMPWDYGSSGETEPMGRICGQRISRAWLKEAQNPEAPPVHPGVRFTEDLPAGVKRLIEPYLEGRRFRTMFPVDLWTQMGFRVIGATAVRASAHGPVLPRYNLLHANIRAWWKAIRRTGQMGLIATSWARGTTFCPPNFNTDLTWPSIAELAQGGGRRPKPFWPGVPQSTVRRIVAQLGRCREDWAIESRLIEEMNRLRPRVKAHLHEWDSLILMARALELRRRIDHALLEVDYFHASCRPVGAEWQRRINDQVALIKQITALRKEVRAHFGRRYHGDAFEEWLRDLFDLHEARLKEAGRICREKKARATQRYAT